MLLILLFIEGLTILAIRRLIGVHIFVGLLLLPPLVVKVASTGYRFVRYYTGHAEYIQKGPPPAVLRWTAPALVAFSALVMGTGVGLLATTPQRSGLLLTAHKASFLIWFGLMTVHVLGHLVETARLSVRDWRVRVESSPGRALRRALLVGSLVAGLGLAVAVTPANSAWSSDRGGHHSQDGG